MFPGVCACVHACMCFLHFSTGNGDIMSYEDFEKHREITGLSGVMIAR